jgi:hypothetical protein
MQKWEYMSLWFQWAEKIKIDGKQHNDVWYFEYKGKQYLVSERERVMNEMGQNGWELVCTIPFDTTSSPGIIPVTYTYGYRLFFKRPIP